MEGSQNSAGFPVQTGVSSGKFCSAIGPHALVMSFPSLPHTAPLNIVGAHSLHCRLSASLFASNNSNHRKICFDLITASHWRKRKKKKKIPSNFCFFFLRPNKWLLLWKSIHLCKATIHICVLDVPSLTSLERFLKKLLNSKWGLGLCTRSDGIFLLPVWGF